MSDPGTDSEHKKTKKEKKKEAKTRLKKKENDKFPVQDYRDPVFKGNDKDPVFGNNADTAFTDAAARNSL